MRNRKLLTVVLCAVLTFASGTMNASVYASNPESAVSAQDDSGSGQAEEVVAEEEPEVPPETAPPETDPPETDPPETDPPETDPPETMPPETDPPETDPPETMPPETQETVPVESETVETTPSVEEPSESETETESESEGETSTQTEEIEEVSEKETEKDTESETESESESETSKYGSNEELIAHQNIVIPPDIQLEFRFTQVEERLAIVRKKEGASVYEEKSEDAREVGVLEYYGYAYILEDQEDGWYYIESGNVRGFMKADDMITDETAEMVEKIKGMEELIPARLLIARTENTAFNHTHTTVQEVMAEKEYAVASGSVNIYEQRKDSARVTGVLPDQGLCYLLADQDKDWVFVESGDARGFVQKSQLQIGNQAVQKVSDVGENQMSLAELKIEPEENKACYYTLTSVQEASQAAKTREAIVNFALQFLGNPYVWGGTSLTAGADCSGFVQSVYSYFGYSLPRVADAQSEYGMQIPIDCAEPGDLIFYARNGYVYHVSMYIGNGMVVHAAGRRVGIITSGIGGNAVWATRLITD